MNLNLVKQIAGKSLGRTGLIVQKHSPMILSSVGVASVVASAVLVGRATLKLEPIVDETEKLVELSKQHKLESKELDADKMHKRELAVIYVSSGAKIAKLYAPAVTLGVAGIGCLLGAQGILQKRNVALAAAYKSLEQGFASYRKRVVEEVGEEKELELYRNRHLIDQESKDEKGEVIIQKALDPNQKSIYARFFDEQSPHFQRQPEYNLVFLKHTQSMLNDMLLAKGHVFLNEVYDALGLERSQAGSVVGWYLNENGDNFIDFGMYDFDSDRGRAFVNGNENAIFLDFNVDGLIFDKLREN